jgi:hypothetical protein
MAWMTSTTFPTRSNVRQEGVHTTSFGKGKKGRKEKKEKEKEKKEKEKKEKQNNEWESDKSSRINSLALVTIFGQRWEGKARAEDWLIWSTSQLVTELVNTNNQVGNKTPHTCNLKLSVPAGCHCGGDRELPSFSSSCLESRL